jgi:hypothetical protein
MTTSKVSARKPTPRLDFEKRIARKIVHTFLHAGCTIEVRTGEETILKNSTNLSQILKAMLSVGESWLFFYTGRRTMGRLHFVWDNPNGCLCGYSKGLEPILEPINGWIEQDCPLTGWKKSCF